MPSFAELIPVLQTSIGPMILISGMGLLLLTMTNRLGRVIDRARILAVDSRAVSDSQDARVSGQIDILWKRMRVIRAAIALALVSALLAAILIIFIFFTALWQLHAAGIIIAIFAACMISLIGSLIFFIHDINLALSAVKVELFAKNSEQ